MQSLFMILADILPEFVKTLNKPALQSSIEQLENQLDIKFPEELKEIFLNHDGQKFGATGLFWGYRLMSLIEIEAYMKMVATPHTNMIYPQGNSIPEKAVKAMSNNLRWVPFLESNGSSFVALDFDPDVNGYSGQVISLDVENDNNYVLANSCIDFLDWYYRHLVNGNSKVVAFAEGDIEFSPRYPECGDVLQYLDKILPLNPETLPDTKSDN